MFSILFEGFKHALFSQVSGKELCIFVQILAKKKKDISFKELFFLLLNPNDYLFTTHL